jgi:hypothetical protein
MAKFTRIAQMPPEPPMEGGGGDMPMGAPPMGMPPMGAPPVMPTAAPGAPVDPEREEIGSPLDTLGKILYDVDAPTLIMQMTGSSPEDVATSVWEMYGGEKTGGVDKSKIGARIPKTDVEPEEEKKEQKATENSRWRRLPQGKHIGNITRLDELVSTMKGLVMNTIKNESKKGQGGPGGGAPPMPMASAKQKWVRMAEKLDQQGEYQLADSIDRHLKSF